MHFLFSVLYLNRLRCLVYTAAPLSCSWSASNAGGGCPLCSLGSRACRQHRGAGGGSPPRVLVNKSQMGSASAHCSAALPPHCAQPCCSHRGCARLGGSGSARFCPDLLPNEAQVKGELGDCTAGPRVSQATTSFFQDLISASGMLRCMCGCAMLLDSTPSTTSSWRSSTLSQ